MIILDRDRQLVMSVGRWRQLTSKQLEAMHFADAKSTTRLKVALLRLVESKYLARIERRPVGGAGKGSGGYVYQLGREGWKLYGHERKYWPYRAIDHHTLAIADSYVKALELEQSGEVQILGYSTEPESWRTVGGYELRPDLHLELGLIEQRRRAAYWLEIDMGTERQSKIAEKLVAYTRALEEGSADELALMTGVIFVAPDAHRLRELRWLIDKGDREARKLFRVVELSELAEALTA